MPGIAGAVERWVRVVGSLDESNLPALTKAISGGDAVLDLSEVTDADETAVSLLAFLPPGQCSFVGCPRWLARRVERRLWEIAREGC